MRVQCSVARVICGVPDGLPHFVRTALLHKYRAAANVATAVVDHGQRLFFIEKFIDLPLQAGALGKFTKRGLHSLTGNLVILNFGQRLFIEPL